MMEWLPYLGSAYPEAVNIIVSVDPISLTTNSVLFLLRESTLVTDYPQETANLLVYLSRCITTDHNAEYMLQIAERLTSLP
ncbi:hypothetical protein ACXWO5_10785, partial [Streptococcus pyogenes]